RRAQVQYVGGEETICVFPGFWTLQVATSHFWLPQRTQRGEPQPKRMQPRSSANRPLAGEFVGRFRAFLPLANYPVRAGAHGNTAFAILLALQYASAVGDADFSDLCRDKARAWYENDEACQAWEPCL